MSKTPPAPPAPMLPAKTQSPRSAIPSPIPLNLTTGIIPGGDRIAIYGTGGIGKSTLAAWLPNAIFFDVERSTKKIEATRDLIVSLLELRGKLATIEASPPAGLRSVVIDTVTILEELVKEHIISTRMTEKGQRVESIEGYGYGKGWQFVYDEFVALFADLDRIADQGLNICLIAHDVSTSVPNPTGEDFIRWEPHLYGGDKRGRANVRSLLKNWCEHVLFISYDMHVADGKASGAGTRTIFTQELPTHIAKSRTKQIVQPFTLEDPGLVWRELGIQ